jgi:hypothetical protein
MIPTLLLFGLIFGRWWRLSLIAAAIGWPLLLVATGVMRLSPGLLGARLFIPEGGSWGESSSD